MKQQTLTISIPKDEMTLYNEINRIGSLTYTPTSMLCRKLLRDGLENMNEASKLSPQNV
tara:strand:- start:222 stop:398 length:177 start_codon:yes stop_codon:yes gene_type:complete